MLCPYYIRESNKAIVCEMDGERWIRFSSPEEKYKFRDQHCAFASAIKCPRYNEHRRRFTEEGVKPLPPRASMDNKWKDYHTQWVRNRRKDPDYKY